jgi:hypothetical protein
MSTQTNRATVAEAFEGWMNGTRSITSLLADELSVSANKSWDKFSINSSTTPPGHICGSIGQPL